MGQVITGLATGDIVVKKDGAALTDVMDYALTGLDGTSVVITFKAPAGLVSTSEVTVEMTKIGYTINGGATIAVTSTIPLAIGDSYGGGKIAYIFLPGDPGYDAGQLHGLIAATSDQDDGVDGVVNWTAAVDLAQSYNGGGFSDWYLPSKDELNKLFINRVAIGGFCEYQYWSSSVLTANDNAYMQEFLHGQVWFNTKDNPCSVRAVRNF